MRHVAIAVAAAALVSAAPASEPPEWVEREALPVPEALAPRVAFWRDVLTSYTVRDVLVHDRAHPERILTVVQIPDALEPRSPRARRWIDDRARDFRLWCRAAADSLRAGLPVRLAERSPAAPLDADALDAWSENVRLQQGLREVFAASHSRSALYIDHIREVFAEFRIPDQIVLLPHLESGFDPLAGSRAGARGLWQFTRATGRQYLRIDDVVDERLDPIVSTRAAARYLVSAYEILGTWPLALTAYNYGVNGMRRAVERHGHDLATVLDEYDASPMGFATRNFYASFLAVVEVMSQPERFYPDAAPAVALVSAGIRMPAYVEAEALAEHAGVPLEALRAANPSLSANVWAGERWIPEGFVVHVPGCAPSDADSLVAGLPAAACYDMQRLPTYHRIQRGDTLSGIAAAYSITVSDLLRLNALSNPHEIFAGQRLELPRRAEPRTR